MSAFMKEKLSSKAPSRGGLGNSSANSLEGAVSLLVFHATQTQEPSPKALSPGSQVHPRQSRNPENLAVSRCRQEHLEYESWFKTQSSQLYLQCK